MASDKSNNERVIGILDNGDDDDVSFLTFKTQDELIAFLVQARKQLSGAFVGSWVASGSNLPPEAAQLPCNPKPTWVDRSPSLPTVPLQALRETKLERMHTAGWAANSCTQCPPCIHKEGDNQQA